MPFSYYHTKFQINISKTALCLSSNSRCFTTLLQCPLRDIDVSTESQRGLRQTNGFCLGSAPAVCLFPAGLSGWWWAWVVAPFFFNFFYYSSCSLSVRVYTYISGSAQMDKRKPAWHFLHLQKMFRHRAEVSQACLTTTHTQTHTLSCCRAYLWCAAFSSSEKKSKKINKKEKTFPLLDNALECATVKQHHLYGCLSRMWQWCQISRAI